jgi:PIN domain nuclease of toxin-antitoxin system
MTSYVADTHALLWYLGGSKLLSAAARSAFDETANSSSQVYIPVIVLAEAVMLAENRHITLDIDTILTALKSRAGFELVPLSPEVAVEIRKLTALRDIHDRLIVAEAMRLGATLITRDLQITACGLTPVVW